MRIRTVILILLLSGGTSQAQSFSCTVESGWFAIPGFIGLPPYEFVVDGSTLSVNGREIGTFVWDPSPPSRGLVTGVRADRRAEVDSLFASWQEIALIAHRSSSTWEDVTAVLDSTIRATPGIIHVDDKHINFGREHELIFNPQGRWRRDFALVENYGPEAAIRILRAGDFRNLVETIGHLKNGGLHVCEGWPPNITFGGRNRAEELFNALIEQADDDQTFGMEEIYAARRAVQQAATAGGSE